MVRNWCLFYTVFKSLKQKIVIIRLCLKNTLAAEWRLSEWGLIHTEEVLRAEGLEIVNIDNQRSFVVKGSRKLALLQSRLPNTLFSMFFLFKFPWVPLRPQFSVYHGFFFSNREMSSIKDGGVNAGITDLAQFNPHLQINSFCSSQILTQNLKSRTTFPKHQYLLKNTSPE